MSSTVIISIADDFNPYPAGRDNGDGPFNGEEFRKSILLPKYQEARTKNVELEISLIGVKSFGSSFLEESFGGLVRKEHVSKKDLLRRLKIIFDSASHTRYKSAIERYINNA